MHILPLETPNGEMLLEIPSLNTNLKDILDQYKLPANSISAYYEHADGNISVYCNLYAPISSIVTNKEFVNLKLRTDRNIDYASLINKPINLHNSASPTAEYSFDNHELDSQVHHFQLSQIECKAFVTDYVKEFFKNINLSSAPIVVGISGGGDSNTLLNALINSGLINKEQLVPVIALGIPDWDLALERAELICQESGLALKVVSSVEIDKLLKRTKKTGNWTVDFERFYPNTEIEVICPLIVRLALSAVAREINAQAVIIGSNLEDILADCFLLTMQGKLPSKFPVRQVDNITIWYPLYKCPKKILDGCYPRLSLQNYQSRSPSKNYWRSLVYYISQSLNNTLPGVEYKLLEGWQNISNNHYTKPIYVEELGFSTLDEVAAEDIAHWNAFIHG